MERQSRDEWAKRIQRWKDSGLTGAEFAAEIGVKEGTLRHWKWALRRHEREPGWEAAAARRRRGRRAGFVELVAPEIADAGVVADLIELVSPTGWRVRIPAQFDAELLRRILDAIGSR